MPHKFCPEMQQAFVEYYNNALKPSDAPVLFMDAVHPTQSTKLSYGWIRKGQDKLIETTGSRTRLNLTGALPLEDIGATVTETYDTINSESIVRFFWKLKKEHYPLEEKVHLVLDGAAYHRTELVKDAAKVLNIDLHYLPPYSPNLNPVERLWKVMNEHVRNNIYFPTKATFTSAIKEFFNVTLPKVAGSITSRITDNFQLLEPAPSSWTGIVLIATKTLRLFRSSNYAQIMNHFLDWPDYNVSQVIESQHDYQVCAGQKIHLHCTFTVTP